MELLDYVRDHSVGFIIDYGMEIFITLFRRGPLLYSYVIQNLSWQLGFWFVTIPLGLSVISIFFFVPEVYYLLLQSILGR